jgi:hypothetical protein
VQSDMGERTENVGENFDSAHGRRIAGRHTGPVMRLVDNSSRYTSRSV